MEDRNEHEELRRTAPTLCGLAKTDPFVTPDGFFEQFPHRVQALVTKPSRRGIPVWWKRVAIALPLVALLSLGARWLMTDRSAPAPDVPVLAFDATDLSDADLEELDAHELMPADGSDAPSPWATIDMDLSDAEFLAYAEQEGLDLTELIDHP